MNRLKLTLIRGLPGSGKSTLAKTLNAVHLEADMYFINKQGEYQFDPKELKKAHLWCQNQCKYYLSEGQNVVIANTFVKHWEMQAYRKLAKLFNAQFSIKVCTGNFQNSHNVDLLLINKMKKNWQP
ncbi:MAG: putative kinase [Psychromonas sp.]|uniref:ATP-binding protein n=1 Tax=Psychromonas sp. TaxID=1884585 RepID=UPI0039E42597